MPSQNSPGPLHHQRLTREVKTSILLNAFAAWLVLTCVMPSVAQSGASYGNDGSTQQSLQQLQSEVHDLKEMVLQLQQQTLSSHAEIIRLREQLAADRDNASPQADMVDEQSPAYASLERRLSQAEENEQLLSGKVDEQYQTKVESASKYRVRLSGIALFNLFGNSGSVDNQDVPTWVAAPTPIASSGSVGGTLRQSILGLEVFGPDWMGAHTSGSINFDFGGGFPDVYNGVNSGLVRLRTAVVRLDWRDTSIIGGQDQLFLSPNEPTSFVSLTVPPLSYAGNLWSWTPQLRVEHRFALSGKSMAMLQAGVLDPVTGELPAANDYTWYRTPDAGEESRQPAYALRVSYARPMLGQTFTVGAGGYFSREDWGYRRIVDGWAGTLDANLPLSRKFTLSAFLYRGEAIGGIGGALSRSVVFNGPLSDSATYVEGLSTVGGWAQLKFRATPKLEFNGAFGQDSPFASDIRNLSYQSSEYVPSYYTANRAVFGNVIYRPRSDLIFSAEYRRLRTFTIYDNSFEAGQVNMAMGVLF